MRTRSLVLFLLAVGLAALLVAHASADPASRKNPDGQGVPATVIPATNTVNLVVGTITYDNNIPFQRDGQVDGMVGNRFTPGMNPHTLTNITFRVAGNYGASVLASVWQPGAGTASLLRRWIVNGVPSGGGATAATLVAPVASFGGAASPVTGHSGSFIAGIRNTFYTALACVPPSTGLNTTCDGVALTQGTSTIGNGLNGVRIVFSDPGFTPSVTMVASSGGNINQNAILRATGNNLPVELMSFSLD
ncbi:MAG: hypothetical protein MI919_13665 [Holophagales bacterium]|nr:hypothetical protein [Holophagales bacterium]